MKLYRERRRGLLEEFSEFESSLLPNSEESIWLRKGSNHNVEGWTQEPPCPKPQLLSRIYRTVREGARLSYPSGFN